MLKTLPCRLPVTALAPTNHATLLSTQYTDIRRLPEAVYDVAVCLKVH